MQCVIKNGANSHGNCSTNEKEARHLFKEVNNVSVILASGAKGEEVCSQCKELRAKAIKENVENVDPDEL